MVRIKKFPQPALYLITGAIIGILIGSTTIMLLVSYRVDKLYEKIVFLETVIQDKNIQLTQLEKSINKNKLILQEIKVNLDCSEDEIDILTLQKYIKEKYSHLIGKEIESIDMDLAIGVIDNRILKLNEKEYKLTVNRILLTKIMEIWINAKLTL